MKMHYLQASGNTSGGVCDDCQHNTEGVHCEFCMESFYKDPEKDLNHEEVCLPCDCNLDGTEWGDTSCASMIEEGSDEVAGQCNCKTHVGGRQCDHCAPGVLNSDLLRIQIMIKRLSTQGTGTSPLKTLMDASSAPVTYMAQCSRPMEAATRIPGTAHAKETSPELETVTSALTNITACQSPIHSAVRHVTVIQVEPTTTTVTSTRVNACADPTSR